MSSYRRNSKNRRKLRLAVTLGDPSGIGPEVALKSVASGAIRRKADIILVGSIPDYLKKSPYLCALLSNDRSVRFFDPLSQSQSSILPHRFPVGKPSALSGEAAFCAIKKAVDMALRKEVDGIVTAPVSKVSLELARHRCSSSDGHTEILKKLTGAQRVQMVMSVSPPMGASRAAGFFYNNKNNNGCSIRQKDIRTVLVTRHLPLSKVSDEISESGIISAAVDYASVFGKKTKFLVCALNPHAGDKGLLGDEEIRIIVPAIRRLKVMGFFAEGPMPSDSAFALLATRDDFDCALAMYHDQAMTPLKVINPRGIVNVTLGLPFIRTSPGHGVAYDIAGRIGFADEKPMLRAIEFAARHATRFLK